MDASGPASILILPSRPRRRRGPRASLCPWRPHGVHILGDGTVIAQRKGPLIRGPVRRITKWNSETAHTLSLSIARMRPWPLRLPAGTARTSPRSTRARPSYPAGKKARRPRRATAAASSSACLMSTMTSECRCGLASHPTCLSHRPSRASAPRGATAGGPSRGARAGRRPCRRSFRKSSR